jgi:hypothetical protein
MCLDPQPLHQVARGDGAIQRRRRTETPTIPALTPGGGRVRMPIPTVLPTPPAALTIAKPLSA